MSCLKQYKSLPKKGLVPTISTGGELKHPDERKHSTARRVNNPLVGRRHQPTVEGDEDDRDPFDRPPAEATRSTRGKVHYRLVDAVRRRNRGRRAASAAASVSGASSEASEASEGGNSDADTDRRHRPPAPSKQPKKKTKNLMTELS